MKIKPRFSRSGVGPMIFFFDFIPVKGLRCWRVLFYFILLVLLYFFVLLEISFSSVIRESSFD